MTSKGEENSGDGSSARRGRVVVLTIASLIAFAGNSVLCRLALLADEGESAAIDPLSFTAVRILSGAVILAPFLGLAARDRGSAPRRIPWASVLSLFVYAIGFSLAYVTLETGVGALLLFGMVQITMVGAGVLGGERIGGARAVGMAVAIAGVVMLVAPASAALASDPPDAIGAALMAIAGIAWGVYSLRGRGATAPVQRTAVNFALCVPLALVALTLADREWSTRGLALAATSGAVTSGAGYAIWYAALRGHTATSAAIVQLTVPVIAAAGGVAFAGESITGRLVLASVMVLGGVAYALVRGRARGTS